jgi:hypothetical protein
MPARAIHCKAAHAAVASGGRKSLPWSYVEAKPKFIGDHCGSAGSQHRK